MSNKNKAQKIVTMYGVIDYTEGCHRCGLDLYLTSYISFGGNDKPCDMHRKEAEEEMQKDTYFR